MCPTTSSYPNRRGPMSRTDLVSSRRAITRWLSCAVAVLGCVAAGDRAEAAGTEQPIYGMRFGASFSPDQVTVGGFWGFPEFLEGLRLRPSGDVGFGDSITTAVLNADLQYAFHRANTSFLPFVGLSPSLVYVKFEDHGTPGFDDSSTDVGFAAFAGLEKEIGRYLTGGLELRGELDNYPDFKIVLSLGFL